IYGRAKGTAYSHREYRRFLQPNLTRSEAAPSVEPLEAGPYFKVRRGPGAPSERKLLLRLLPKLPASRYLIEHHRPQTRRGGWSLTSGEAARAARQSLHWT